mgnify:CR=1 FL=1
MNKEFKEKVKGYVDSFLTNSAFRKQLKIKLKACKDKESEECQQLRAEIRAMVQTILLRHLNRTIARLEKVKERISESEKLTEEEKETILSDLDEAISKLEEIYNKVEAGELSIPELRKEIKQVIKWTHKVRAIGKIKLRMRRVGLIVKRAEAIEKALDRIIEKYNLSEDEHVQELVLEVKTELEAAKEAYNASKAAWEEVKELIANFPKTSGQEVRDKVKEAQSYLHEAQEHLRKAHQIIVEIIKYIHGAGEGEEETEECADVNVTINETQAKELAIEWANQAYNLTLDQSSITSIKLKCKDNEVFYKVKVKVETETIKIECELKVDANTREVSGKCEIEVEEETNETEVNETEEINETEINETEIINETEE